MSEKELEFEEAYFCEPSNGECEICGDEEPTCRDCGKDLASIFGQLIYCCKETGEHLCEKCFKKSRQAKKNE